jgi:hypothetical protein
MFSAATFHPKLENLKDRSMETPQTKQFSTKASQTQDLGAEIYSFPVRNLSYKHVIGTTLGTSIILAAISFFTLGFYELVMAVRLHGRAMVLLHAPPLILLLASLPVGVIILAVTAINWNNHLTLFDQGLVERRGLRTRIWTWEETNRLDTRITHIKFGGSIIDMRVCLILGKPRDTLLMRNHYEDMSHLIQQIRVRVLPYLVEQTSERLNKNHPIEFTKNLLATRQGVEVNGKSFFWNQIEKPIIKNRKLILRESQSQQKVFHVNLKRITNLDLLIYLFNHPPRPIG